MKIKTPEAYSGFYTGIPIDNGYTHEYCHLPVYGQLLWIGDKPYIIVEPELIDVFTKGFFEPVIKGSIVEVYPETLRRYIGIKDKNQFWLYVGDKVKVKLKRNNKELMCTIIEEDGCILFESEYGDKYFMSAIDKKSIELL